MRPSDGARSRERVYGVVLLAVGTAVLLISAFQANIWFDESYSVAIASHQFAEIWSIGSHDVHPVLYYWMLHVVYLVFGKSIVAFRIFTLLGSVAMASLGITCIARDFGERTGLLFTFLSLFVPIVGFMCLQVRMYSWASFAVALTAVYAYRISTVAMFHADSGDGEARTQGEVPLRWWAVLFGASLASAYLHYYAAIAAFLINVFLLVDLVRGKAARREVLSFLCGAAVTVACYLPWMVALSGQVTHVSSGFWIEVSFPETLYEVLDYLVVTPVTQEVIEGSCGSVVQMVAVVSSIALALLTAAFSVWMVVRLWRRARTSREARRSPSPDDRTRAAAWCGMGVYGGIIVVALVLSQVIGQAILYYRYLYVALCFPLFFLAVALSHVDGRRATWAFCGLTLVVSVISQAALAKNCYAPEDRAIVDSYDEIVGELSDGGNKPLVVSENIGIAGVLAERDPTVSIEYLDVYWDTAEAYEAYAPTISIVESLHDTLDDYSGRYVVVGSTDTLGDDQSVYVFAEEYDSEVVEVRDFAYPYSSEDGYYVIAVLER